MWTVPPLSRRTQAAAEKGPVPGSRSPLCGTSTRPGTCRRAQDDVARGGVWPGVDPQGVGRPHLAPAGQGAVVRRWAAVGGVEDLGPLVRGGGAVEWVVRRRPLQGQADRVGGAGGEAQEGVLAVGVGPGRGLRRIQPAVLVGVEVGGHAGGPDLAGVLGAVAVGVVENGAVDGGEPVQEEVDDGGVARRRRCPCTGWCWKRASRT